MHSNNTKHILGIMSGSSLDGLDLALCSFSNQDGQIKWKLVHQAFYPLDESLKNKLSKGTDLNLKEMYACEAHFCKIVADAVLAFEGFAEADLIASHGHTIVHLPNQNITVQLGNGGLISSLTNKDVVSDFRIQDVGLGGEGTPLVPIAERDLFPGYKYYLNLGGIANLSTNHLGRWQAFDVGPFNQVLNHFSKKLGQEYDDRGNLASMGKLADRCMVELNKEAFFSKLPPKSLDNNWIKNTWIPNIEGMGLRPIDVLHNYVNFMVNKIGEVCKMEEEGAKLLLSGGGAKNDYFVRLLRAELEKKGIEVEMPTEIILDYKEAILMAYLGYLRAIEELNILKSVTAAKASVSAGAYYLAPKS